MITKLLAFLRGKQVKTGDLNNSRLWDNKYLIVVSKTTEFYFPFEIGEVVECVSDQGSMVKVRRVLENIPTIRDDYDMVLSTERQRCSRYFRRSYFKLKEYNE